MVIMNHYWWLVISEVFETDLCGLRLVLCRFAGFKYSRQEQEDCLGLIDLSRLRCPSTVLNEHFRPQCLNTKHTQSNTLDLNTLTENTVDTVTLNTETKILGPSVIEHTCVNNLWLHFTFSTCHFKWPPPTCFEYFGYQHHKFTQMQYEHTTNA